MTSPLYNSRGTWSATVPYNYLDAVQYGKYTYICTNSSGSTNQRPDLNAVVWVQMPVIIQEDQYYLRSREDLLQYEDARYQSLMNAMANFYTARNDQSYWGSFLRAVAIELARIEYMFSYDIVAKNPQYLTPPDIKREYANPLFVTGNFQQLSQFDSGDFGASFGQWVVNTGTIARTAILDSNSNIQIAAVGGSTGTSEPSWAVALNATFGLSSVTASVDGTSNYAWTGYGAPDTFVGESVLVGGFANASNNGAFSVVASTSSILTLDNASAVAETNSAATVTTGVTVDGNVVWTNAGPAPNTLAYPIGYRDMLVDLLAAYQLGATPVSIQDVIYAYTGKNIVVEELYKEIVPGGFYDQSDRNAIKVSVNVGGNDPLVDIESLTELQQITNSLYGAIDLAKPAHVGLEFTTIFGSDENIDCFISPRYLTQYQLNTLTAAQKQYYTLIAYALTKLIASGWVSGWTPNTIFIAGQAIQDSNGNIQICTVGGVSNTTAPNWGTAVGDTTTESSAASPPQPVTWLNIVTPQLWSSSTHYNTGDVVIGINQNTYLALAPSLNQSPLNVWGTWFGATQYDYLDSVQWNGNTYLCTALSGSLNQIPDQTPSAWTLSTQYWMVLPLDTAPQISIATYQATSPSLQPLFQGLYQNLNCVGTGIQDTLRIIIQQYEEPPFDPMLYQAPITVETNPMTTLAAYGRRVLSPLNAANWAALQTTPQVWSNTVTYSRGALVRGVTASTSGSFNDGVWTSGGWQLYRALKKTTGQSPLSSPTYWSPLPSPSVYQAYYQASNGQYIVGIKPWASSSQFYVGELAIDNAGNMQLAAIVPVTSPPTAPMTAPVVFVSTSSVGPANVSIEDNVLTLQLAGSGTVGMGLVPGVSSVSLLDFTYATFLNALTLPVTSLTSGSVSMTYVHADYTSSVSQAENLANIRVAFSTSASVPTYDGNIVWQYLGPDPYTNPAKWIQVVDSTNNVTGEVANWDINHPMGLLAPRQDLVWEIAGGDEFTSYEME